MTKQTIQFFFTALCFGSLVLISSCKKDCAEKDVDTQLYEMSTDATGFVWYKNSSALLLKSPGSGHFPPYLRTRYNALAATQLDAEGKINANAVFPEGSLVVKELYTDTAVVERYAILYKDSDNPAADNKGWVWGYIDADGFVQNSANDKGAICTGCHLQTDNIDYMLMNKYFP
jgi:hypothetical protein